jgi:Pyruvate/2-oxoacid:ferredoxin oxidoreductase delta subunit
MSMPIRLAFILLVLAPVILVWIKLEGTLFPRRSTIDFWRLSNMPFLKKLEGYFYAARPAIYLRPATWQWVIRLFGNREEGQTYHGKIMTKKDTARLINVNEPVHLTELEHVIPYDVARDIILNDPLPSLAAMDCPCRAQKKDACEPRDVCIVMGEPIVSFVMEHHPNKARRLTVDEALKIIEAEEQRGHIHTAWFKDSMHDRFYTICNCCTCCCLGMKSFFRGTPRIAHSGYSPAIDASICAGCGTCEGICPFSAIADQGGRPVIDTGKCMGCGLCVTHCRIGAISLSLAPQKGTPLNIERLTQR